MNVLHERTWTEIDLDALAKNVRRVRECAGPGVQLMPVLKADAYGHGAIPVAWRLAREGVAALGVGDSAEALELRAAGITLPIVILGAIVPGELPDVVRGAIDVTVHSGDRVRALRSALRHHGGQVRVHLKVDTGMGRLGCHPERALGIAREVDRSHRMSLVGLATHLASVKPDGGATARQQLRRFDRVLEQLRAASLLPRWLHVYASGGTLSTLPQHFNLARPGLALYGISPHARSQEGLEPVLAWRTQIVFLKDHRRGSPIGYEGAWTAPKRSRIATLPLGYNDGYRFAFSNRAEVLVRGRRCPVVGRVSMDYTCVDVTNVEGAAVGDIVTLLGRDGGESVSAEELARWGRTITHDILCGIGRRVRRRYQSAPEIPDLLPRPEMPRPPAPE